MLQQIRVAPALLTRYGAGVIHPVVRYTPASDRSCDVAPGLFIPSSDIPRRVDSSCDVAPGLFTPSSDIPRPAHWVRVCRSNCVAHRPARLPPEHYRGPVRCFFTTCTANRAPHFHDLAFGRIIASQLLTTASTRRIDVLAYCLMPDHAHVLLEAHARTESVLDTFVEWKHRAALLARRRRDVRLWQESFWDRILRADDDSWSSAAYIMANPLRAGLTQRIGEYSLAGSSVYSFDGMQALDLGDALAGVHWRTG